MSRENKDLPKQRVWEIDAYRGYRMLLLLALHLYVTVYEFCIDGYYNINSYTWVNITDPLHFWFDWGEDGVIYQAFLTQSIRVNWVQFGIAGFFIVSGICCTFTKSKWQRIVRTLCAGYFISMFTFVIYLMTGEEHRFIRFGAVMCYGYCYLIYYLCLENRSNKFLLSLAVPILLIGYYLLEKPIYTKWSILYPFGFQEYGAASTEFFPIFPYLGWLLIGVVWGRKYYKKKQSLLPLPMADRLTRPLQWIGRYSGIIYVSHIVVYTVIFCGIGYIFHLF